MNENSSIIGSKEYLESLANGLKVLSLYSRERPALSIHDVAERLDIARASARRILLTLASLEYVKQSDRSFLPTPKILDLGFSYFSSLDLSDLVRPILSKVAETVGETCSIGVLEGSDIVFLCREETAKPLRLDLKIGSRLPAYAHSMGHALLSQVDTPVLDSYLEHTTLKALTPHTITSSQALRRQLKTVREQGFSVSIDELVEGFAGIAIPISIPRSSSPAALSISLVYGKRTREEMISKILPVLREAAQQIRDRYINLG